MKNKKQIPGSIANAVNSLLSPYGINIDSHIKSSNNKTKYLSPTKAAEYCSMSRWTIFKAIKDGALPAMKMNKKKNGKVLIDVEDLKAWIEKHRLQNMGEYKNEN